MTHSAQVSFYLTSKEDIDLSFLNEYIGIHATSTSRKGGSKIKRSTRSLSCPFVQSKTLDIKVMAHDLVSSLLPHKQRIQDAISEFSLEAFLDVPLTLDFSDEYAAPSLLFDTHTVKFLGEVSAEIGVGVQIKDMNK